MLLIFFIGLTLCGCQKGNSLTLSVQMTPQETNILVDSTALIPTETPNPPTKTATLIPTRLFDAHATQTFQVKESLEVTMNQFPFSCDWINQRLLSPQGNWLAISCEYKIDQTLEVVNRMGKKWVLNYTDYLLREPGMGGLYPESWSKDERYLYFSSYIAYDGGGPCCYGFGDAGLFRLDVETGKVSTILQLKDSMSGYFLQFSPDGRWLVFTNGPMYLHDLQTGVNTQIKTEGHPGDITWLADSSAFLYATCEVDETEFAAANSSILLYSIETKTTKLIFSQADQFLRIYPLFSNEFVEIFSQNQKTWEGTNYLLELSTFSLSELD